MSFTARLAALALVLALAGATADQPKTGDEALYDTLKEIINEGVDLYNGGEPGACYYTYRGALKSLRPTLDRYPEVQKMVVRRMAAAEKDPVMWRRAFALRDVLDKVRAEVKPVKDKLGMPKKDEEKKEGKEDEGKKDEAKKDDKAKEKAEGDKKDPDKAKKADEKKEGDKKDKDMDD